MYERFNRLPLWLRILVRLASGSLVVTVVWLLVRPPPVLLLGMIVIFVIVPPIIEWKRAPKDR